MRQRVAQLLESPAGKNTVLLLILINAILIGAETYPSVDEQYHSTLDKIDAFILMLFTLEIALRLFADESGNRAVRDVRVHAARRRLHSRHRRLSHRGRTAPAPRPA